MTRATHIFGVYNTVSARILYLATVYLKREETQAAYYCYFLSRHWNQRHRQMDQIQQVILILSAKNSLYCRINATQGPLRLRKPRILVSALLELGKVRNPPRKGDHRGTSHPHRKL